MIVATPGTETVVLGAAAAARVIAGTIGTFTLPFAIEDVPVTAPVVGLTVHDELTASAVTVVLPTMLVNSVALRLATLALAPPAVAVVVMTPVVTRPETLADATVLLAGPPGYALAAKGPQVTIPAQRRPVELVCPGAADAAGARATDAAAVNPSAATARRPRLLAVVVVFAGELNMVDPFPLP